MPAKQSYGLWFRLYVGVLDDHKVQALDADTFKFWINLLCVAARHDGSLPKTEVLGFEMRLPQAIILPNVKRLVEAGLVDDDGVTVTPHNWRGRQFKVDEKDPTAAERMRNYRKRHGGVRRNKRRNATVTVTPAIAEQSRAKQSRAEQTETPQEPPQSGGAFEGDRLLDEFETVFWSAYPHRVDKPDALKAFLKARQGGKVRGKPERKPTDLATIVAGLERYKAGKPADHHWMNPSTFLNQERYSDEPGEEPAGRHHNGNGHSRDPKAAIFRALADVATEGAGVAGGRPDPDAGVRDLAGPGAGDPAQTLDLEPAAFRRA